MSKRISAILTALLLPATLAAAEFASAQDTIQTQRPIRARVHRLDAGAGPGMGFGAGMGGPMRGHAGPAMLLDLKDELELSAEQVGRLTELRDRHHSQMQEQLKSVNELRTSLREARLENDWDALEQGIDRMAALRTGMAKSVLNVERESLGVLDDQQRQKVRTWQEGYRLLQRQGMRVGRHMRGMMGGRGMRRGGGPGGPPNRD